MKAACFLAALAAIGFATLGCGQPSIIGVWDADPKSPCENSTEFRQDGTFKGVLILEDKKRPGSLIRATTSGTYHFSDGKLTQNVEHLKMVSVDSNGKETVLTDKSPKKIGIVNVRFISSDVAETSYKIKEMKFGDMDFGGRMRRRR